MNNSELYHYESLNELAFNFPEMSKKELEAEGAKRAAELMDAGDINEFKALASAERLKSFAESFAKQLRKDIVAVPEKNYKAHGCEFSISNTGDRLDYEQDDVYKSLKEQLKAREELLKVAYKQKEAMYDADGVEIPKVGVKSYGSEVLKLKF